MMRRPPHRGGGNKRTSVGEFVNIPSRNCSYDNVKTYFRDAYANSDPERRIGKGRPKAASYQSVRTIGNGAAHRRVRARYDGGSSGVVAALSQPDPCADRSTLALRPFQIAPTGKESSVQVLVRDNNVDQALKVLRNKMQREGVFREMKLRGNCEKPSERKTREKAEAVRRARKLARKKMQRDGLLPMTPRPAFRNSGRDGPPRAPRF
jgi:small subunit ribosomal protein S21